MQSFKIHISSFQLSYLSLRYEYFKSVPFLHTLYVSSVHVSTESTVYQLLMRILNSNEFKAESKIGKPREAM